MNNSTAVVIGLDVIAYMSRATSRAESDVANKLVSMFLHQLSRMACREIGASVTDRDYAERIVATFGNKCAYCSRSLEPDRTALEHLEAMNRVRAGLHVPGNVVLACKACNNNKRHDDQVRQGLACTGWESFLTHDSSRCPPPCITCRYWRGIWADSAVVVENLRLARTRIEQFRASYPQVLTWSKTVREKAGPRLEKLYRDCQEFARLSINQAVADIACDFS